MSYSLSELTVVVQWREGATKYVGGTTRCATVGADGLLVHDGATIPVEVLDLVGAIRQELGRQERQERARTYISGS